MTRLEVTVERMPQPIAVHTTRPRFTWIPETTHERQLGYEIEVRDAVGAVCWSTGLVASDESSLVEYDGEPLQSDSDYRVRVRAHYPDGASEWADSGFGTSLLDADDWVHPWIEPTQPDVTEDGAHRFEEMFTYVSDTPPEARLHPPRRIRQRVTVPNGIARARLYATAQGIYTAWINGRRVGDEEFAPGNDSYRSHISFQGYDVTDLLNAGENIRLRDGRRPFTGLCRIRTYTTCAFRSNPANFNQDQPRGLSLRSMLVSDPSRGPVFPFSHTYPQP